MRVLRLSPHSLVSTSRFGNGNGNGRCSACDKPIRPNDEFVCMYGEQFHRDCAFYRPRR
jgi:hypothetical protein